MADNEIQILITAVNQASEILKQVQQDTASMANSNIEENTKVIKSQENQITSLLAVSNAVQSAEGIMSAYENMNLRLENAQDRVDNSSQRVQDAQLKLTRLQQSGTASLQDLTDAQTEVERSNRQLEISQNNLKRAENARVSTIIMMTVESLRFLQALPAVINSIKILTSTEKIAEVAESAWNIAKAIGLALSGPYGWAILAGAAAVGFATVAIIKHVEAQNVANDNTKAATTNYDNVTTSVDNYADALAKVNDMLYSQIQAVSPQEKAAKQAELDIRQQILDKQKELNDITNSYAYSHTGGKDTKAYEEAQINAQNIKYEIDLLKKKDDKAKQSYQDTYAYARQLQTDQLELSKVNVDNTKKTDAVLLQEAKDFTIGVINEYNKIYELQNKIASFGKTNVFSKSPTYSSSSTSQNSNSNLGVSYANPFTSKTSSPFKVNDAIITKEGKVIETNKNDNILAFQGGLPGGTVIYITGDNYGTDPKKIGDAIMKQLRYKIAL